MSAVTREVVNAAWAEAPESRRHVCHGGTVIVEIGRSDLHRILEAAAPAIAAAERERIRQFAIAHDAMAWDDRDPAESGQIPFADLLREQP